MNVLILDNKNIDDGEFSCMVPPPPSWVKTHDGGKVTIPIGKMKKSNLSVTVESNHIQIIGLQNDNNGNECIIKSIGIPKSLDSSTVTCNHVVGGLLIEAKSVKRIK